MSVEIERKFLVKTPPAALETAEKVLIRQGYLLVDENGNELRVRQKGSRFFQTLKKGEGLCRTEIEIELDQNQFESLWPHTTGRRVCKTRYRFSLNGFTAEYDQFDGKLAGLCLVEVEFMSVEDARHFSPPEWFGTEVTEDKRYKNKCLAANGIPDNETDNATEGEGKGQS